MTETIEATQILKQDKLGRVITPAPRREALLEKFESSGMSGAAIVFTFNNRSGPLSPHILYTAPYQSEQNCDFEYEGMFA